MIGVALAANTVAFFGITYFDQSVLAWYALLAMISGVGAVAAIDKRSKAATPVPVQAVALPSEERTDSAVAPYLVK